MDYSQLFSIRNEVSLVALILVLLVYDLFSGPKWRDRFGFVACILLGLHIVQNIIPQASIELFGGMYTYTPITGVVKSILAIGTLVVFMLSETWLKREDTSFKRGEFYVLTLCTLLGLYFMISAGNFMLLFIGLETASIPLACLVAFDKYRHNSAEAGAKYILTAIFSSGLMLFGISFIYGTAGTLYFNDIFSHITGSPLQIMAFVFFFSGLAFKISLVPFHLWTADVYEGSPTLVTGYLSVISKGAAVFVLMTVLLKVFMPMIEQWQLMLYVIIVVTITIANIFAIRQDNLKRLMAFSSISQAGYLLLGVIGASNDGMSSLVYYILVYMLANLAVFGVISIIEQRSGKVEKDDYDGLYKTNPKLSFILTLSLFSLAGIPPFAGFFSKFFIFMSAFKAGFHLLVFIALLNTVISLYYYLLIIKAIYINKGTEQDGEQKCVIPFFKSDNYTRISLALCLFGILFLGLVSAVYEGIFAII